MMSVSDDSSGSDENGGGTLQLWRINDLIYRPEKDVLQELDAHRQAITAHKLEKTSKPAQNPKKVCKLVSNLEWCSVKYRVSQAAECSSSGYVQYGVVLFRTVHMRLLCTRRYVLFLFILPVLCCAGEPEGGCMFDQVHRMC